MDKIIQHASKCRTASSYDTVHKSECVFTFHNPYTRPSGIVVNLNTFIGTIEELAFQEIDNDNDQQGLFLRIVKTRIPKSQEDQVEKDQVTKLGIGIEGGFQSEKFDTETVYSVVVLRKEHISAESVSILGEVPYDSGSKLNFPVNVMQSVESIIHHAGEAVQQDIKAFELNEEVPISKYAETLEFVDNGVKVSPNPQDWKCEKSGDTENLWLNLSTGFIGGGRRNWDGSGGSNGALDHFLETGEKYPLVVKLGTISKDMDTADCYSYAKDEDGPVRIPNLAELLAKRGIQVSSMQKTAKSTSELEVELNATYAFDAITESGSKLVPISGPGYQGLQNLGNSCYINSVLQMLFSGTVPELVSRYGTVANGDIVHQPLLKVNPKRAPCDLLCQTAKIACALTSGTFALPLGLDAVEREGTDSGLDLSLDHASEEDLSSHPKYRIPPRMFKHVVGKDHVDFCTGQQQDAAQFLQYLLEKLDRAELGAAEGRLWNKMDANSGIPKTSELFAYRTTSRLVCMADRKVKYKDSPPETILSLRIPLKKNQEEEDSVTPDTGVLLEPEEKRQRAEEEQKEVPTVTFQACLDSWAETHTIDDMRWSHLNNDVATATVETRFGNFPRYMIVQLQRYELGSDWVPRKLEVKIDVPEEIDLSALRCKGPQDGEDVVMDEVAGEKIEGKSSTSSPRITIDERALGQLMDMGFGMNGCIRALNAVGGNNVELAMNWIFEHNSDPDFNDPLPEGEQTDGVSHHGLDNPAVDERLVSSLVENLGCFTSDQVRAALKECEGAADRAADWLFSHMHDLDSALASLESKNIVQESNIYCSLEDGEGKYRLVGIVSHIGKNTTSGHYVAHLKKDGKWIIFNDEKVALSEAPPIPHAYLYLFQRMDSMGSSNPSY